MDIILAIVIWCAIGFLSMVWIHRRIDNFVVGDIPLAFLTSVGGPLNLFIAFVIYLDEDVNFPGSKKIIFKKKE